MDPLSLTANIIGVVSAAASVSNILLNVALLKNAPAELLQFSNEVCEVPSSDLLAVNFTLDLRYRGCSNISP